MKLLDQRISVDFSDSVQLLSYFRMCRSMLNMASQYEQEGSLDKAYVLQKRFNVLFLDYLSKRPDYRSLDRTVRKGWSIECNNVLEHVEVLHKKLMAKYESEAKLAAVAAERKAEAARQALKIKPANQPQARGKIANGGPFPSTTKVPETPENKSDNRVAPSHALPHPIDRSLKPPIAAGLTKLTPVLLSSSLSKHFMEIAGSNTRDDRETCGTLCGRISSEGYVITHLVIPKQSGTANSCTTYGEEDLLAFMDANSLIAFGWIHTHPTQTVFMSSLDLHCQLSYQLMLPEAIAIVCSPKYEDVQYFSLTPDYGVQFLLDCKLQGFHKHSNTRDLYCKSPHIRLTDQPIIVKDLR
ncbi:unnamed protein product [Schistocephalus solidus]|uniref:MPN domain-containing protein n=1 Tax=Schistocephalus solidus TaxID=70667 RepID=A0A183TMT0_SCHSO|nr:unnamed protein product [Schistocephalus solidus]